MDWKSKQVWNCIEMRVFFIFSFSSCFFLKTILNNNKLMETYDTGKLIIWIWIFEILMPPSVIKEKKKNIWWRIKEYLIWFWKIKFSLWDHCKTGLIAILFLKSFKPNIPVFCNWKNLKSLDVRRTKENKDKEGRWSPVSQFTSSFVSVFFFPLPSYTCGHPISTYTCRVTITPRMYGGMWGVNIITN